MVSLVDMIANAQNFYSHPGVIDASARLRGADVNQAALQAAQARAIDQESQAAIDMQKLSAMAAGMSPDQIFKTFSPIIGVKEAAALAESAQKGMELGQPAAPETTGLPEGYMWGDGGAAVPIPGIKPKAEADAEAALPGIIDDAQQTIDLIDEMVGSKDGKTKPHPGFKGAVGAGVQKTLTAFIPGVDFFPGTDAADFMAKLKQVQGKQFLQAYEKLKGGGAISEVEGKKAEAAMAAMQNSQTEDAFIKSARDLQEVIKKGVERAANKAGVSGDGLISNASAIVKVSTPEDAMKLPSGTVFITPDGRRKVRP